MVPAKGFKRNCSGAMVDEISSLHGFCKLIIIGYIAFGPLNKLQQVFSISFIISDDFFQDIPVACSSVNCPHFFTL